MTPRFLWTGHQVRYSMQDLVFLLYMGLLIAQLITLSKLLVVLSKDPYTTEIPNLALSIGLDAQSKGNEVSFYLIEDGVTAARNGGFAEKILDAQSKGIQFFACLLY